MPKQMENGSLAVVLVVVSVVFGWILWPFFGAILWGVVLSIIFAPAYQVRAGVDAALAERCGERDCAADRDPRCVPLTLVAGGLVQEVSGLFERLQSGELDLRRSLAEIRSSLPEWAMNLLTQLELTRLADVAERLSTALMQGGQFIAGQVLSIRPGDAELPPQRLRHAVSAVLPAAGRGHAARVCPARHSAAAGAAAGAVQQASPLRFAATLKGDLVIASCRGYWAG